MSRTIKNSHIEFYGCRKVKTYSTKVKELSAKEYLIEEGYSLSNREKARGNPNSPVIPNAYDDIRVGVRSHTKSKIMRRAILELLSLIGVPPKSVVIKNLHKNKVVCTIYNDVDIKGKPCGAILGSIKGQFIKDTMRPLLSIEWVHGEKTPYIKVN